ncbi:MAG TPA: dicarboxylate/amino acid:cation symporter [Planctomycetaceae bacterium]|nr:dicarboxylate/amino acid:cation symporter [Planctomycetaceae bacterium]
MSKERPRFAIPLSLRVVIAAAIGTALGAAFGKESYVPFFEFGNRQLGQLGAVVIQLLKALAIPLIFLAILDAFIRTTMSFRQARRLIFFCLLNVIVAMTLGLTIMNTLQPGRQWVGKLDAMLADMSETADQRKESGAAKPAAPEASLSLVNNVVGWIPKSIVDPFKDNNAIPVVLLAVFAGAALRRIRRISLADESIEGIRAVERFLSGAYQIVLQMIEWVVQAVPFAVLGILADVVGKARLDVFGLLWAFLWTILLGLCIHAFIYYPLMAWLVGGKSPREYVGKGAESIINAFSFNSSLVALPLTLRCLDRMHVSPESARMAACIGTNLNNDGITLYEAMAALFLAQALGFHLGLEQQITIVLASIMAGAGIAGIPEAGLIVLPLVLGATGLSAEVVATTIPLLLTVDWIIARFRSAVNAMNDMLIAILIDAHRPAGDATKS